MSKLPRVTANVTAGTRTHELSNSQMTVQHLNPAHHMTISSKLSLAEIQL